MFKQLADEIFKRGLITDSSATEAKLISVVQNENTSSNVTLILPGGSTMTGSALV